MLRVVETKNGFIKGLQAADPRITSFKGIPFAEPPIGGYRWCAPQPVKNWEGVFNATDFAPISMQAATWVDKENIYTREWAVDPDIPMNEDCLYLNVWTPACSTDEKLPVYVWYFGGGLQVGNTAEMEFDGERISRRGIVVVTVNYRLNAFGFLCHPEITKENEAAPANFGHLDQQMGTQWVKQNIAAFGGDPDNITIGGQSAGGGSVLNQIASPQNEGLFHRAIIQSGLITEIYPGNVMPIVRQTLLEAEREGEKFFEYLGVATLEQARALEAEFVLNKVLAYGKFWGTVVDNTFCVGNAFDRFIDNKRWQVPILLGYTSTEFISAPKVNSIEEVKKMAYELFGNDADEFLELCHVDSGNLELVMDKASVRMMEYAVHIAALSNANHGGKFPMYCYNFDAEIPGWDHPGTFHSVDLWFFFETLAKCWRPFVGKHYDLARQMCNYWANFIRSGNPNGKDSTGEDLPLWEPYTKEAPYGMVFGETSEFVKLQPDEVMNFLVKEFFKKRKC